MIAKALTLAAFVATAGAVACFAPAKPEPQAATVAPVAGSQSKCDCSGPADCVCTDCKCLNCVKLPKPEPVAVVKPGPPKVEPPAPVAAEPPKYTQPQPVAKPAPAKAAPPVRYVMQPAYRLEYRASYGRFGMRRGGQWVRVPVQQQYSRQYRSCSNGGCR